MSAATGAPKRSGGASTAAALTLRLFQRSDLSHEIDRRVLHDGELSIGRDSAADWAIADPSKTLSRLHAMVASCDGALTLRDDSTNGVFLNGGDRLVPGTPTPLAAGDRVALGDFVILVDAKPPARPARPRSATVAIVEDAVRAGQVLDAFCAGAQIDASVFAGEDAADVMRRLGVVYREMVSGLAELMNERTRAKAKYGLEWTTVQAADNNPFRWAPPQRVAVDLLQPSQEGFMPSGTAVRSSFDDLGAHHRGLLAGSRAALEAVMTELAPDAVAETLKGQSFLMKNRGAALWVEYGEVHARLAASLETWAGSPAGRAFRTAYDDASEPDETKRD